MLKIYNKQKTSKKDVIFQLWEINKSNSKHYLVVWVHSIDFRYWAIFYVYIKRPHISQSLAFFVYIFQLIHNRLLSFWMNSIYLLTIIKLQN